MEGEETSRGGRPGSKRVVVERLGVMWGAGATGVNLLVSVLVTAGNKDAKKELMGRYLGSI